MNVRTSLLAYLSFRELNLSFRVRRRGSGATARPSGLAWARHSIA